MGTKRAMGIKSPAQLVGTRLDAAGAKPVMQAAHACDVERPVLR